MPVLAGRLVAVAFDCRGFQLLDFLKASKRDSIKSRDVEQRQNVLFAQNIRCRHDELIKYTEQYLKHDNETMNF